MRLNLLKWNVESKMSEYQDWVLTYDNIDIINVEMDHPDCWYCPPNEYPALLPCVSDEEE